MRIQKAHIFNTKPAGTPSNNIEPKLSIKKVISTLKDQAAARKADQNTQKSQTVPFKIDITA